MRYLYHASDEEAVFRNAQVLGSEDPVLEFNSEGRSVRPLKEEVAEQLSAMHRHVALAERVHDANTTSDGAKDTAGEDTESDRENSSKAFDAEEFVDRTPMSEVVDDIENGEADGHLNAVEAEASRQGVLDAVDSRRSELEDEG